MAQMASVIAEANSKVAIVETITQILLCLLRDRPVDNLWTACWFRRGYRLTMVNPRFTADIGNVL